MRAFLWSTALFAVGALALPGIKQEKRDNTASTDGSCGASSGETCTGSSFGNCCSGAGYCGSNNTYCGQGCQSGYGVCTGEVNGLLISNDGTCGSGVTCQGSIFGDCCSNSGFCGSTSDYCSTSSCNSAYGLCGSATSSSTSATSYSNSTTTTSALAATTTNPTCPKSNGTIYVATSLNEYEIDCGWDRPGNDLKSVQVYSNTISGCIAQCEATTGCVDIIMSGTACYMKKAIGKTVKSSGLRGARLFKLGPSASTVSTTSSTTSSASSGSSVSSTASSTSSSSSAATSSSSSSGSSSSSAASSTSSITPAGSSSSSSSSSSSNSTSSSTTPLTGSSSVSSTGSSSSSAAIPVSTNPTCPASNATEFVATSGAVFLIECYMDRAGNDMKSVQIYSNKIADCINACDSTAGCVDISMSGTACYMKNNAGTVTNTKNVRGARMISAAPSSSSSSSSISSTASSSASSGTSGSSAVSASSSASSSSFSISSGTSSSSSTVSGVSLTPSASVNSTSTVSGTGTISSSASSSVSSSSSSAVSATPSISINSTSSVITTSSVVLSANSSTYSASGSPTVSSNVTSSVVLSTGVSSPSSTLLSTGASSDASSSSTSSAPYDLGNGTSTTVASSGTGATSVPLTTGDSSSTSVAFNITSVISAAASSAASSAAASVTSADNSTASIVVTTAPLTTAPVSAGSNLTSSSTGLYTNSTTLANSTTTASSTTSFPFAAGGIPSGHAVVTNTSACSTAPTSTASCSRCAGQPGTDKFCGYTATDNSYEVMPITCNTVEYSLVLTECTVSPDGYKRSALCVNGQSPGPLITASWGDTVIVHVTNSMSRNGTSVHWHGIRQNHTNEMDGVVSITQCALAPGQSQTYTFKASNYGFSWYHSHLSLQAYEGAFGPMLIDGPKTQTADVSAGQLIIQDWSHTPVDDMYYDAEVNGPRTLDTGLINGLNVFGDDNSTSQTGSRYTVPTEFVSNKTYMFNIVNTAIQSTYKFYIDNHTMTVISADFVPIVPYETNILNINIGQRYQVIVRADQAVGDYWLRFDNQNACATTVQSDNIKGIIHYSGGPGATPNSIAYDYDRKYAGGSMLGTCTDEDLSNLVPAYAINVGSETTEVDKTLIISNANDLNLYRWYLDGTTFQSSWADATLYDIYNNNTVPDYSGNLAIEVPDLGEWVYVIIESPIPLGHPIHLHGHDFHILARGYGTYDSSVELNLSNPPRRDVAFLPGDGPTGQGGFLVLAFYTDNPGVWLMHCHIGWHVSMGFALQFVEAQDLIADTVTNSCVLNDVCSTWRDWADDHSIGTDDSGV